MSADTSAKPMQAARPWLTTAALLLFSLALTWWLRERGSVGGRPEILFALPFGATLLAAGLGGSVRKQPIGRGWLSAALVALVAFVIDLSFVPLGMRLEWITLTFGDNRLLESLFGTLSWSLPVCLVGGIAVEWALRRRLFEASSPPALGFLLSLAAGLGLSLVAVFGTTNGPPTNFYVSAVFAAAALELALTATYAVTRRSLLTGIWRGLATFSSMIGLQDWYGLAFPLANYTESDARIYWLRPAVAGLAAAVVLVWAGLRGRTRP